METRLSKYDEISRKQIEGMLVYIWNTRGYKDCKDISEVWERVIEKYGGSELIALITWFNNRF